MSYGPRCENCGWEVPELATLRAQLVDVTKERDELAKGVNDMAQDLSAARKERDATLEKVLREQMALEAQLAQVQEERDTANRQWHEVAALVTNLRGQLAQVQREAGHLRKALEVLWDNEGTHEDPDCPEDPTCECANVARINRALSTEASKGWVSPEEHAEALQDIIRYQLELQAMRRALTEWQSGGYVDQTPVTSVVDAPPLSREERRLERERIAPSPRTEADDMLTTEEAQALVQAEKAKWEPYLHHRILCGVNEDGNGVCSCNLDVLLREKP